MEFAGTRSGSPSKATRRALQNKECGLRSPSLGKVRHTEARKMSSIGSGGNSGGTGQKSGSSAANSGQSWPTRSNTVIANPVSRQDGRFLGRITVYTRAGSRLCNNVLKKLEDMDVPFSEINIDIHTERHEELCRIAENDVTPQVFFNERYLTGNEFFDAESSGDLDNLIDYARMSRAPTHAPAVLPSWDSQSFGGHPGGYSEDGEGDVDEIGLLAIDIRASNLVKDRTYRFRSYKKCLVGSELVTWIVMEKGFTRPQALEAGKTLVERHFLHHVCYDHGFKDEKLFYRLLDDEPTEALNTFDRCTVQPRPAKILADVMRRQILSMYDLFLSPDGKSVDYEAMGESEEFHQYCKLSCELQRCDVISLEPKERMAFFINIYNVLVMHASTHFESPTTAWDRFKFFNSISYVIGGLEYSLSAIENGVLRANKRAPNQVHKPFAKSDPRAAICLQTVDPRVHFAIVCGAKSCPPIKVYSAEELDEQLDVAVASFLDDGGVAVDEGRHEIHLSRIFQWYQTDFADTKYELLKWIITYMPPGDTCRKLFNMIRTLNYRIVFQPYDWASNSSK